MTFRFVLNMLFLCAMWAAIAFALAPDKDHLAHAPHQTQEASE